MKVEHFEDTQMLKYVYHSENDIHEIVYRGASCEVFDDYIRFVESLYEESRNASTALLRLLLNGENAGVPPVNYIMSQLRAVYARYPDRPNSRSAVIIRDRAIASVVDTAFRMIRAKDMVRFFLPAQREQAIQWLLAG